MQRVLAVPLVALLVLVTACAPDPSRLEAERLYSRLVETQADLRGSAISPADACNAAGEIRARLFVVQAPRGDTSLWPRLIQAADALTSACGEQQLAELPGGGTRAAAQARAAWQQGASVQLRSLCDDLRALAAELRHPAPAC